MLSWQNYHPSAVVEIVAVEQLGLLISVSWCILLLLLLLLLFSVSNYVQWMMDSFLRRRFLVDLVVTLPWYVLICFLLCVFVFCLLWWRVTKTTNLVLLAILKGGEKRGISENISRGECRLEGKSCRSSLFQSEKTQSYENKHIKLKHNTEVHQELFRAKDSSLHSRSITHRRHYRERQVDPSIATNLLLDDYYYQLQ